MSFRIAITARIIVVTLLCCHVKHSNGQDCIDNVSARQRGTSTAPSTAQVIVPRSNFSCNGRITGYAISLIALRMRSGDYPSVQVWRPMNSTFYSRVGTACALTEDDINRSIDNNGDDYYLGLVQCSERNRIEFQSGDVIGYYQSGDLVFQLWDINTTGYTSYYHRTMIPLTTFDINSAADGNNRQPLIEVMYDIRCDDLSTPANGEITSCISGGVGVSYEGDTCSFTCNTGYELTGSDTRTCQNDGSWSGSDDVCRRVPCSSLIDPNNGVINCSLRDDGVPSYEDTCSFTCNTGYELTGSDTRTCQSNGSWSGSDDVCRRVSCPTLTDPNNGVFKCSLGDDGVPSYEDTCSFTCNTGYELTGSGTRICQSDGSWSGSDVVCSRTLSSTTTSNTVVTTAAASVVLFTTTPVSSSVVMSNVPISSNSGSSSVSVVVIGGAVGGVILLLMIIVVLCIVILCVRRSHRKKGFKDDKVTYSTSKLNTDVTMDHNSSYDATKASTVDCTYDDTINSDIPITTNPSYNVHTKPYSKTSEDDYNYVQPNDTDIDVDGYIKIHLSIDQSHDIRGIYSYSTGNTPLQDEYELINQPYN